MVICQITAKRLVSDLITKRKWNSKIESEYDQEITTITNRRQLCGTHTKEKADICNRQFQSALTCEANSDPPSKGASPFSSMGEITVHRKGVPKLLDGFYAHKAHDLNARVLKECSTQILAQIYNESLAQGNVPDD